MAKRIQLDRQGTMNIARWCKKTGIVYAGPGSKWSNPFVVIPGSGRFETRTQVLELYTLFLDHEVQAGRLDFEEIRNMDIGCWCGLNVLCHVDILLETMATCPWWIASQASSKPVRG